jgi:O-antigen ligase
LRLVDVLWLSGVAVACYALAVYPLPQGVIEAEGVRRARAFYGSPNNLALYLERLLPISLALVIAWRRQSAWRRWLYGLGALPMLAALVLTFSRGAWLLGIPAGLLTLAWLHGGKLRYTALALFVVGVIVLVPLARTPRFASLLDPTKGTTFLRVSLWQAAWDMVRDHPWLGVGLDNFLYYYRDYIRPGAEVDRYLSHPHNVVLDFWLRLGIGGLAVLGALLDGFVRGARRGLRQTVDAGARAVSLGLAAGMAAALAHGLIDASFFVAELAYWFLFALAWVTSA